MLESKELAVLKTIGNRVRQLRIDNGYSQESLGYEAEIPKNQVGRIERGEINTTVITLYKISSVFNIKLSELIQL